MRMIAAAGSSVGVENVGMTVTVSDGPPDVGVQAPSKKINRKRMYFFMSRLYHYSQ